MGLLTSRTVIKLLTGVAVARGIGSRAAPALALLATLPRAAMAVCIPIDLGMRRQRAADSIFACALGLALVCGDARATHAESVIHISINQPTSGTLSYNGSGGPLVGTNVTVDFFIGLDTPLNTDVTRTCVSCTLNFTTGPLTGTTSSMWIWDSGGSFTLTGGIDLDNNGTIGASDVPLNTQILSGTFGGATMSKVGSTFRVMGADLTDQKVTALTDFYGTASGETYSAGMNLKRIV